MTVVVDDPLIARMAISRMLPLHESSRRLRELYPECPRVYGVAVMGDLSRRRWWPLAEVLTTDRLRDMFDAAGAETDSRVAVAPAAGRHAVPRRHRAGRARCSSLEGRAWDTGWRTSGCTSTPRARSTGSASSDPTLRALPDDPYFNGRLRTAPPASRPGSHRRAAQRGGPDDLGRAPQSPRPRTAVRQAVRGQRRVRLPVAAMWHIVGAAVVSAATQVPLLAGSSELTSMRRGQAVLDALVGFGRRSAVRAGRRGGKALLN